MISRESSGITLDFTPSHFSNKIFYSQEREVILLKKVEHFLVTCQYLASTPTGTHV